MVAARRAVSAVTAAPLCRGTNDLRHCRPCLRDLLAHALAGGAVAAAREGDKGAPLSTNRPAGGRQGTTPGDAANQCEWPVATRRDSGHTVCSLQFDLACICTRLPACTSSRHCRHCLIASGIVASLHQPVDARTSPCSPNGRAAGRAAPRTRLPMSAPCRQCLGSGWR